MPPDLQPLAQRRPRHVLRVQNYPMIIRPQPRRNCCVRCRLGLRSPARPPGRPRAAAARGRDVAEAHAQQQLKPETAAPPAACQYARVPGPSPTESGPQAQGPAPVRSHRGQLPPKSRSPPAARRLPVPYHTTRRHGSADRAAGQSIGMRTRTHAADDTYSPPFPHHPITSPPPPPPQPLSGVAGSGRTEPGSSQADQTEPGSGPRGPAAVGRGWEWSDACGSRRRPACGSRKRPVWAASGTL